jgi:Family of unknown function (DUF6527)
MELPGVEVAEDGQGVEFIHVCTSFVRRARLPLGADGWSWDPETQTVSPSIHCLTCDTHGFWENGKWRSV